jgi:hypothetical protein
MYTNVYGDDYSKVIGTRGQLKADMLSAGVNFVGNPIEIMTVENYFKDVEIVIDDPALALVINIDSWQGTDGGDVHIDLMSGESIAVGGWYFKLSAEAVQGLIDLGYGEMSFTATIRGYGGSIATDFYLSQSSTWFKSGDTLTFRLEDYATTGIKFRPATGGAAETYFSDGSILIENIVFGEAAPIEDEEAFAIFTNAANWSETDGGTVHVDSSKSTTVQVGGWFFKLNADAVQALIDLGYSEISFTATGSGGANYFYFSQTKEWYAAGSTVTINLHLAVYAGNGIKIRGSSTNSDAGFCDGSLLFENIVFTKAESSDAKAMAMVVNEANWSETGGGSVHVDAATSNSITVGGWYFKLNADTVKALVDLGYTKISFKVTGKWYGGNTPTHFYFSQTSTWYASGATITLNLADYANDGIKMNVGNGSSTSDGSMLIDNIVFTK